MQMLPTEPHHIPEIMQIIDDAVGYLASKNIDQWQNGYPNQEQIENDIANKESYVVLNPEGKVMGTTMFTLRSEPTYKVIEGEWIIDESKPYGVIHRMAVSNKFRGHGVAKFVFDKCHGLLQSKSIQSLKIDTHEENLAMQSLIKSQGYKYCGIIYTNYGAKRLAFEKVLSK